jgi:trigger factor
VRLPGFRPGKVPRKVLEARVGTEAAREDAIQRHLLPEHYAQAIIEHEVDAIAPPDIELTGGQEEGPLAFDAVVEIRPQVAIGGYASLRVVIDSPEVTDDDVDHRIEHLREQFATLSTVDRAARPDDIVTIDITGSRDGEAVEGLTADEYQYRVGSGSVVPELDDTLAGAKVGDILTFTAQHPRNDDSIDFRVLVKEVRETVLPELDDAFAEEASEFSSVDELRADTRSRLGPVKLAQARAMLRDRVTDALAELVDDELPEALIESEMRARLQDLALRLGAQGVELSDFLAMTGQDPEAFKADLRSTAQKLVSVDLALRAIALAEDITADDDELDEELASAAARVDQPVKKLRAQLESNGQLSLVRSDLRTRKAMDWVLARVEVVDADGAPVDRDLLLADPEEGDEEPQGAAVTATAPTAAAPTDDTHDDTEEQD